MNTASRFSLAHASRDMAEVLQAIDELWREDHPNGPDGPHGRIRLSYTQRMIWGDLLAALDKAGVMRLDEIYDDHEDDLTSELVSIVRAQAL